MEDQNTLEHYNILEESTIHLVLRERCAFFMSQAQQSLTLSCQRPADTAATCAAQGRLRPCPAPALASAVATARWLRHRLHARKQSDPGVKVNTVLDTLFIVLAVARQTCIVDTG